MTSRPKTKWEFHRSFLIALFPTLYLFIYFYGRASGTAAYNYWYSNIHYLLILKAPFSLFSIDSLWIPWSLLFSSTSYLEENFEILLGSLSCGAYGKRNPTEQRFKRPLSEIKSTLASLKNSNGDLSFNWILRSPRKWLKDLLEKELFREDLHDVNSIHWCSL